MAERGLLIAFEGGDGGGKSTQARLLAERLDAVLTRQAGGTPLGQRVREIVLDPNDHPKTIRAEALLFMADRADHIAEVIEPALGRGQHVVTDRYAYSSLAYQGYGGGLDVDELRELADWAMQGVWPDVVIFIDVPVDVSVSRRQLRDGHVDKFEAAGDDFQSRVMNGFRAMADAEPDRWRKIDGTGSVDDVAARVWDAVSPFLN